MISQYHYSGHGRLTLETPLHIGSGDEDIAVGAQVQRNLDGEPVIPATSLAGVMRSLARDVARVAEYDSFLPCSSSEPCAPTDDEGEEQVCVVCRLMGSAKMNPSRLWINDAVLQKNTDNNTQMDTEVRDHVGVNRQTGAAAPKRLFNREIVPRGSVFEFRFSLRLDEKDEKVCELLMAVLSIWEKEGGQLGGHSAGGLGQFGFQYELRGLDLRNAKHLEAVMFDDIPSSNSDIGSKCNYSPKYKRREYDIIKKERPIGGRRWLPEILRWHLRLRPTGPLMVKTDFAHLVEGADDSSPAIDHSFVKTAKLDSSGVKMTHYIPGSSLRGALRSHCERILRTKMAELLGEDEYLSWPKRVICDPNIEGDKPNRLKTWSPSEEEDSRAENVWKNSCLACRLFGSTNWGGRVHISDAYPEHPNAYDKQLKILQHVAIDRFSGGSAEGLLFNEQPVYPAPGSDNLDMQLEIEIISPQPWEIALMLFTLRDAYGERIRFGYGKKRGMGKAQIVPDKLEARLVKGSCLYHSLADLKPDSVDKDKLFPFIYWETGFDDTQNGFADAYAPIAGIADRITQSWKDTLNKWHTHLQEEQPHE